MIDSCLSKTAVASPEICANYACTVSANKSTGKFELSLWGKQAQNAIYFSKIAFLACF